MWEDSIVNEVRKIRENHARKFEYDLDKILLDLKKNKENYHNMSIQIIDGKVVFSEKVTLMN